MNSNQYRCTGIDIKKRCFKSARIDEFVTVKWTTNDDLCMLFKTCLSRSSSFTEPQASMKKRSMNREKEDVGSMNLESDFDAIQPRKKYCS